MQLALKNYFKSFLERESVFLDKSVLQINFIPKIILHRDEQINELAKILAPALKLEKPSNIFIYGKTGTGKTVTVNKVLQDLTEVAKEQNIPLKYLYVNCKLGRADTEYRLIASFCRELGVDIPGTGLPTDEVYNTFYNIVDREKVLLILVLDEVDQLVKKIGDDVLYNLTRVNSVLTNSIISLIGISNNVRLLNEVDARVKSSLGEESVVFPPYDAQQIRDILKDRCKLAFKPNVLEQGVIEKCAAIAAQDHGDARRAIDLIRVAGELADREESNKVTLKHLDAAQEKIEKDRVIDIISSQPKQHQCVLYSIISLSKNNEGIYSGNVYDFYVKLCNKIGLRPLTQRRVSDIILEFDTVGLIKSSVISKGRFGRSREINLAIEPLILPRVINILKQSLEI